MTKKEWATFIIIPILVFIFLATYNLTNQYSFNHDPARDTLESLRILQNKEITLIGPPLSLGLHGLRETYFSSAIYYVGAIALAISGSSATAPVILVGLLNASGIIPLVLILKKRKITSRYIYLILALYISNPTVINYSRILWNPSPLIGLGLWGIYAFTRSPILFGIIAGLATYFHYFAGVFFLVGAGLYIFEKKRREALRATIAFFIMLTPFLIFETKNKLYLTQSLIYNVQHVPVYDLVANKLSIFLLIPPTLIGISQDFFGSRLIEVGDAGVWIGLALWTAILWLNKKNRIIWFFLVAAVVTVIASETTVRLQYVFIGLGALLAYGICPLKKLSQTTRNDPLKKWAPAVLMVIIVLQSVNTLYSINSTPYVFAGEIFPTIAQLEETSELILSTHEPGKKFNITESVMGDARAKYLRFFVERDMGGASQDYQDELHYENLEELYVLTPSIEKTLEENRWEFNATEGLELDHASQIGDFLLLKYEMSDLSETETDNVL